VTLKGGKVEKILILDDDEAIRSLYAMELEDEGYSVIPLGDASRVLQLVEQTRPDLILLDIKLGEYDGLDILKDIRSFNYNMPIILCSSYPIFKYDLRSIAADYYVVKSPNLEELKLIVKIALKGGESLHSGQKLEDLQQLYFWDDQIRTSIFGPSFNRSGEKSELELN
jgi:DNA-binding response OmpR family regulator